MKKIIFLITIILSYQVVAKPVLADYTLTTYTNGTGITWQRWGDTYNMYEDDGNFNTHNSLSYENDFKHTFTFDLNSINNGSRINSISVYVKAKKRYSSPSTELSAQIYYDDSGSSEELIAGTSHVSDNIGNSFSVYTFYWSNEPDVNEDVSDYFREHTFNHNTFNVVSKTKASADSNLIDVDYVSIQLFYEEGLAESYITSQTASPSAGLVFLDLSGDTGTKSADMTCDIGIFADCTQLNSAAYITETPIAHIKLDPTYLEDVTLKLDQYVFQGHGFTATSSSWLAENIEIPYTPGATCTYPTQTLCTTKVYTCNEEGCYWTDTIIDVDDYDEGNTAVEQSVFTEPEPDDPVNWFLWRLKKLLVEIFVPNFSEVILQWEAVVNNIKTRVPFAYMYAIGNFQWAVVERETSFSFQIPIYEADNSHDTYVDITLPSVIDDIIEFLEPWERIVVWTLFALYLFKTAKSVLTSGH